jgi:hypothetical protein
VTLAAGRGDHGGGLGEKLADPAELVRHGDGLETRAGLVGFDELLRERVETTHRFLHRDLPCDLRGYRLARDDRTPFII